MSRFGTSAMISVGGVGAYTSFASALGLSLALVYAQPRETILT